MAMTEWILLAYLVVLFPAWELIRGNVLRARLQADPSGKVTAYRNTCLQLWLPTLALLFLFWTGSLSVATLPVLTPPNVAQSIAVAALVLLTIYLLSTLRRVAKDPSVRRQTAEALQPASWMLPTNRREAAWFIGPVSFSAGICEELLYRAYLIQWLDLAMPVWAALILSSLIFGLIHAYQGFPGVIRSSALGLVLGAIFIATGSVLVPILLHVIIDAYSGALAWIALRQDGSPGSGSPADRESL